VLGAVKTEFGKFGDVLAKTKKKIDEAGSAIDAATTRTRAMTRQLRTVEALPEHRVQTLLGGGDDGDANEAGAEPQEPAGNGARAAPQGDLLA
jgi:DNA recombination protein RmuC